MQNMGAEACITDLSFLVPSRAIGTRVSILRHLNKELWHKTVKLM